MTKEEAFEVANKYVASKNPTEELLETTVDKLYGFYKKHHRRIYTLVTPMLLAPYKKSKPLH